MARRFLDDIRSDMAALYVPGGGIAAVDEGALMLDMLDSVIQDECVIFGQTPVPAHPTTTAYVSIGVGYTDTVGGDATFLKANALSGEIQGATTPGFTYNLKGQITVIAQNGIRYDFVILRNGVDVIGALGAITGDGNGDPVGLDISGLALSALADATYTIGVRSPGGASTIDIQAIGLSAIIQPTNNP